MVMAWKHVTCNCACFSIKVETVSLKFENSAQKQDFSFKLDMNIFAFQRLYMLPLNTPAYTFWLTIIRLRLTSKTFV